MQQLLLEQEVLPPEPGQKRTPPPGPWSGYEGEQMPLGAYSALLLLWSGAFAVTLKATRAQGTVLSAGELLLLGVATHKLTRLLTRDWVTAPLRAPFTRYEASLGQGEVREKARGTGLRLALGQLLTCPWCSAPWAATGWVLGMALAPQATRTTAGMLAMVALSDVLQVLYGRLRS